MIEDSPGTISLQELCRKLEQGTTTSRQLVDTYLARIGDPAGEGSRSFLQVAAERARSEADAVDAKRRNGVTVPPFAGIPIAVKDLFDVEGEVTTAGSRVLASSPPASGDAACVGRLRQAGMIVLGRTNMTEFAYSGLGINPHYGTPRSAWKRVEQRIPGGSSSGSAVAVADRQAFVALGTDTGGSCRIPAAFSNIVGYKPTADAIPLDGVTPLAGSLDSVGPLAESVATCRAVHDLMAGGDPEAVRAELRQQSAPAEINVGGLRLALLTTTVLDDLDSEVDTQFERCLAALSTAGVGIVEQQLPELNRLASVNRNGGLAAGEAYRWHQGMLAAAGEVYDPRVRSRIEIGADVSDADLADIAAFRRDLATSFVAASAGFDGWIMPTVAMVPPRLGDFPEYDGGSDDFYRQMNLRALRNTSIGNMLDACAISLPLCRADDRTEAPAVGMMLMAPGLSDQHLLAVAEALEPIAASVA